MSVESESHGVITVPVFDNAVQIMVPTEIVRTHEFIQSLQALERYHQVGLVETFPQRAGQWAEVTEKTIAYEVMTALAKKDPKAPRASIKDDCKKLFRLHVTSVLSGAKKELKEGTKLSRLGKILSFTGELWDGLSDFWNSLVDKHPVLVPLDVFIIRPAAVSLYASILPELGIVKACEFVGRSISGYAKTGKVFSSIVKAAKKTGASVVKHALRLCGGTGMNPAIAAFHDSLGVKESHQKEFLDLITSRDQIKMLRSLDSITASVAAKKLNNALEINPDLSVSMLISPMLLALTSKTEPVLLNLKDFAAHIAIANPEMQEKLAPILKVYSRENIPLDDLLKTIKKYPNVTASEKKELSKYVADYAVDRVLKNLSEKTKPQKKSFVQELAKSKKASEITQGLSRVTKV